MTKTAALVTGGSMEKNGCVVGTKRQFRNDVGSTSAVQVRNEEALVNGAKMKRNGCKVCETRPLWNDVSSTPAI